MSRYKTEEQINAFAFAMFIALILNIGFDLCRVERWGPYVGIPMVLFGFIVIFQYSRTKPKQR